MRVPGDLIMRGVPFGHFSLIDLPGEKIGAAIIAPECILLQRAPTTDIHDLS